MIERFGPLILIAGLAGAAAAALVPSPYFAFAVTLAAGALSLVRFKDLSATDYVYSLTGPLSGASLVLMAVGIAGTLWPPEPVDGASGVAALSVMVLILGVPLYGAVIAGVRADPYRPGFGGPLLPAVLAVGLGAGFLLGSLAVAAWVAVSGLLYLTRAYASRNLIDYLIDPVAVIFALIFLAEAVVGAVMA